MTGAHRTRWVAGGWATLVDALATRARALGVDVVCNERITALEPLDGPVVIATPLAPAGRLLGRPLEWPGTRTALVDVLASSRPRWPDVVVDIRSGTSTCCLIERETAFDPGLVGDSDLDLFQAQLGIPPGVGLSDAVSRIEGALDVAFDRWREQTEWRDARLVVDATGAVDPPGATWRDRPRIDQGDGHFLAGDAVAAPGMLAEVSVNSGVHAARLALEARRRQVFPAAWPSVELTPARRMAVLAAALHGTTTDSAPSSRDWAVEPVDETGPGYRITTKGGFVFGASMDGGRLTALASPPRWLPFRGVINRLAAAATLRLHARRR